MYFIPEAHDRNQQIGLHGFALVRDTSQYQKSLDAILKVMELNPRMGYIKGSSVRRKLEEAFESVPRTSAFELFNQLSRDESPLGKLFHYRLHNVTRAAMLNILWRKHLEQQQQLRQAQQNLRQACEEKKKYIEQRRAALKDFVSATEKVCKAKGENSDDCQELRFQLLEAKMKLDDLISSFGFQCP